MIGLDLEGRRAAKRKKRSSRTGDHSISTWPEPGGGGGQMVSIADGGEESGRHTVYGTQQRRKRKEWGWRQPLVAHQSYIPHLVMDRSAKKREDLTWPVPSLFRRVLCMRGVPRPPGPKLLLATTPDLSRAHWTQPRRTEWACLDCGHAIYYVSTHPPAGNLMSDRNMNMA